MDGPYELNILPADDRVSTVLGVRRGTESIETVFRKTVILNDLIIELLKTSRQLLAFIRKAEVWDADCENLEATIKNLKLLREPL